MSKKLLKMPAAAPVLLGANTALAIAAGVAAVVGVSALHKRRAMAQARSAGSRGGHDDSQALRVGLLRVHVPQNFRCGLHGPGLSLAGWGLMR